MKSLLIIRHAKSTWKDQGLDDHDRPLNRRGKTDAPRVGALLLRENLAPGLIISSTARRARQTAKRIKRAGGFECDLIKDDRVYLADPKQLVSVLREAPSQLERLMLVGHNPGLEELVEALTGIPTMMPTAAVAHVELPVAAWSDLPARGRLAGMWTPREMPDPTGS